VARTGGLHPEQRDGTSAPCLPVLADDDPEYRGVKIPRTFWKVVATTTEAGKLHATAYLLSQKNLLDTLEAGFEFGEFKTFQVPVTRIESASQLDFGTLRDADPLGGLEAGLEVEIELSHVSDVRI
jgi:endonuclease G, mitochondrial